jgi:hypothetical protein
MIELRKNYLNIMLRVLTLMNNFNMKLLSLFIPYIIFCQDFSTEIKKYIYADSRFISRYELDSNAILIYKDSISKTYKIKVNVDTSRFIVKTNLNDDGKNIELNFIGISHRSNQVFYEYHEIFYFHYYLEIAYDGYFSRKISNDYVTLIDERKKKPCFLKRLFKR